MDAPLDVPAVYGLLRPTLHPSRPSLYLSVNTRQPKAFGLGLRELQTADRQPRALLWPDSRRR